jgi:LuxR family quorum sensing-dependent transcriptional regulator
MTASPRERTEPALRELGEKLLGAAVDVIGLDTPEAILNRLDQVTYPSLDLRALVASRFPLKASDWSSRTVDRNTFLHSAAPKGWWEEWNAKRHHHLPIGYMIARAALGPHTMSETLQALQPIGADRWGVDLGLKYGMRDQFYCPVGGRWLIAFWSGKPLSITPATRVMIFAAASFAALRLEQLVGPDPEGGGAMARLTPRELAVLRLFSFGNSVAESVRLLGLGEETIRTHAKAAQTKLGTRNRAHTVAEAIRQHLLV